MQNPVFRRKNPIKNGVKESILLVHNKCVYLSTPGLGRELHPESAVLPLLQQSHIQRDLSSPGQVIHSFPC